LDEARAERKKKFGCFEFHVNSVMDQNPTERLLKEYYYEEGLDAPQYFEKMSKAIEAHNAEYKLLFVDFKAKCEAAVEKIRKQQELARDFWAFRKLPGTSASSGLFEDCPGLLGFLKIARDFWAFRKLPGTSGLFEQCEADVSRVQNAYTREIQDFIKKIKDEQFTPQFETMDDARVEFSKNGEFGNHCRQAHTLAEPDKTTLLLSEDVSHYRMQVEKLVSRFNIKRESIQGKYEKRLSEISEDIHRKLKNISVEAKTARRAQWAKIKNKQNAREIRGSAQHRHRNGGQKRKPVLKTSRRGGHQHSYVHKPLFPELYQSPRSIQTQLGIKHHGQRRHEPYRDRGKGIIGTM